MKISSVIIRILIIILSVEFFVMQIINYLPFRLNHIEEAIIDALLLGMFSLPFIFLFVIKPFIDLKNTAIDNYTYLAYHDDLTSLPNRKKFLELLSDTIKMSHNQKIAVILLQIENLQSINERFGNDGVELAIKEIAKRFDIKCEMKSIVAKLDLNQFIFLFDEQSDDNLYMIAKKILSMLDESISIENTKVSVNGSIGISRYIKDAHNEQELLMYANSAVRTAQSSEFDNISFYAQALTDRVHETFSLEEDMKLAIQENQFFLLYQPKISAASNNIIGVEALIRWKHPRKGLISPNDFISIAEENGLIIQIGEWVIHETLKVLKELINSNRNPVVFSINLSGRQISSKYIDRIIEILKNSEVPLKYIDFEITETYLMKDVETSQKLLERLHSIGVSLSMDDFGTGYSSLGYLKKFKVDYIKIDKQLINDIETDSNDYSIVKAIIAMSESLNLKVIAEGVETQKQVEILKEINCDVFQGYYFSRPVPSKVLFG